MNTKYNNLKELISKSQYQYIFFNVFYTVIKFPFSNIDQIYYLMEKSYNKEIATNVTFMKLRKEAESIVKNSSVYNNITIEKIYDCLNQVFDIDFDICQKLKSIEEKLLIDFSSARNFIKEIYDTAVKFNKKIIFIQNTYYNESTIINILKSNGITKFDNIFTASNKQFNEHLTNLLEFSINNLKINPYNILYFCSDNYNLELAQFLDIKSILIPKTTDKLNSYTLKSLPNSLINSNSFINSSGYDFTTSIIANKYFDNPFRSFTEGSAYNCDPYYLGSCALGMHLLSIIYWILKETTDYNKILFMARDGYLVKKTFDILVQTNKSKKKFPKTEYIHISRRLMMPYIISEYSDLLNFPSLNLFKATPKIMFDLLDFCTKDINKKDLSAFYNDINLSENTCFENKENYYKFIKELYVRFYDKKKHEQSKKALNEYFKNFNNNYITFDLGNYGRVQSAFVKATKKNIDALFLFSNTDVSIIESQKNNFKIKTFYEFYPNGNRSFREYIFSSDEPSCIGLNKMNGIYELKFDNYKVRDLAKREIQQGAIDFVKEYCETFKNHIEEINFKNYEMSLPFETFLCHPNKDLEIFKHSYFEGIFDKENIFDYITNYINNTLV